MATFINKIYLFGLFIESDFTFILNKIALVSRWWSTGDGSNIIVLGKWELVMVTWRIQGMIIT